MHPRPAPLSDDPADYGTAFGLEMSVNPDAMQPRPAAAAPSHAGASGSTWWSRGRQREA
jgi:hypothetical protein